MKVLKKIKISDRLPKKNGNYYTDQGELYFDGIAWKDMYGTYQELDRPLFWYEPIEINLKSEEMLPEDVQNYINKLKKALETAENEIAELKISKSYIRNSKKKQVDIILDACSKLKIKMKEDNKNRYDKAINYLKNHDLSDELSILHEGKGSYYNLKEVMKALKIAAGIN